MVMVLAMAAPSFAAGNGSIKIENATNANDYTAYKIFDVVYNDSQSAYAYTIDLSSAWYDTVDEYSGITLTVTASDSTKMIVTKNDDFNASDFAAHLRTALATVEDEGIPFVNENDVVICKNLDLGYYFVSSETGALCNLTTTDPEVTIKDKNDVPFEKTTSVEGDVEVGDVIPYTIKGEVPDTTGFATYAYTVSDTMSEGLTFNSASLEVSIGTTTVNIDEDAYIEYDPGQNGFILTIDATQLQDQRGEEIVITYTAKVNEEAVSVISENEATLTYGNDSNVGTITDIVKNYTSKIVIDKYAKNEDDLSDTTAKLADAKFVLYKTESSVDGEVKKYYKYDSTSHEVSWVDTVDEATVVITDELGAAEFIGLEDGKYYLLETEAPAGYNLLESPVEVVVNGEDCLAEEADEDAIAAALIYTEAISNSTGTTLPSTGGIGTTIFYAVGIVLMAGAVFFVIRRKRA